MIIKNPPKADIEEAAGHQGMATMYQDGVLKVLAGITTFLEVESVTGAIEWLK